MTRRRPEQDIQKALAEHLRLRQAPGIYWFHPANGGGRSAIEGAILKACGVRAGVPDLILVRDGKTFGLEIKSPKGRLSPAQEAAHEEMKAAGAVVAVAVGIDQALEQLEGWGMLRGRSQ
jgi:VRR-NUC domain